MKRGAVETPIAIIALVRSGPRNAASAIARIRNGQASMASTMRLSTDVDPALREAGEQPGRHADAGGDQHRDDADLAGVYLKDSATEGFDPPNSILILFGIYLRVY